MRQLNTTGYMHNRLRMVAASFLVKDLLVDWRRGERYFADTLIDFDLASNNGGWQWAASTGCDAQPYFRIFNPVTQSERFDPDGKFIRRYVPELARARRRRRSTRRGCVPPAIQQAKRRGRRPRLPGADRRPRRRARRARWRSSPPHGAEPRARRAAPSEPGRAARKQSRAPRRAPCGATRARRSVLLVLAVLLVLGDQLLLQRAAAPARSATAAIVHEPWPPVTDFRRAE